MSDDFYAGGGLSQAARGMDPRDSTNGDEYAIPPHCDRCAKTIEDDARDLCARCEWETGDSTNDAIREHDAPKRVRGGSQ